MILVTGATGLLGSNLLYALSEQQSGLKAMYRNPQGIAKVQQLFETLDPENGVERFRKINWHEGDVLDVIVLDDIMKGVHTVYHCAALVSYRRRDFPRMMKVNGLGTANVVNIAIEHQVKRFVHISSTAAVGKVKGESGEWLVKETNKWTQDKHTSGYAISKYTAEKEVWRGVEEGLNAVILNPSVMFGPANWNDSSMTIFRTVNNGLKFYSPGANAFVDVRDVVEAAQMLAASHLKGERFLCTGTNLTFREMLTLVAAALEKKPPLYRAGKWAGALAWRLQSLIALFTGRQTLTKESVQSSMAKVVYDSAKLVDATAFEFRSIKETIEFAAKNRLKN